MLRPSHLNAELEIVFLPLEELHKACPDHQGDWYFSGDYPTSGGTKLINQAFMNYYENRYNA